MRSLFKYFYLNNKGISVIIPNYNGIELLPIILPPLFIALINSGLRYEIIVSDDASADNSIDYIQLNFPNIILIKNNVNAGFSTTINKGIKLAQYEYVFLLNSDVIISENYFKPLLRYFEREDTFGVMGKIVGWEDDTIQDGAKYPSYHGVKIKTSGNYIAVNPREDDWLYSMYLSGANAFVDKKKLLQLNGFDELFSPYYVEDYELSVRAWRMGWKCYYEHFAVCRHKISVTIKNKSSKSKVKVIYYRNKMFLHALHLSSIKLRVWYFQLIMETLLSLVTGKFYFFSALKYFFKKIPAVNKSRKVFNLILKESKGPEYSLNQIIVFIKKQMAQQPIRKF